MKTWSSIRQTRVLPFAEVVVNYWMNLLVTDCAEMLGKIFIGVGQ